MADSVTQIRSAGPVGAKRNLAILGDGFTAGDQTTYNNWVSDSVLGGVFGHDYFYEDASAFWNIFRVNLESNDSGVSHKTYNADGSITTTPKNTALGMIYSGSWTHCWMEYGSNTETAIDNALQKWVPDYNFVLIILNEPGYGGCGGNEGRAHVTTGDGWAVIAHEFGHGLGGLADEYCNSGAYTAGEPSCRRSHHQHQSLDTEVGELRQSADANSYWQRKLRRL